MTDNIFFSLRYEDENDQTVRSGRQVPKLHESELRRGNSQIPGLASVQDIALSHDDSYALVSFDDDVGCLNSCLLSSIKLTHFLQSPPRLYEVLRSRTIPLRLRLVRKFIPRTSAPQFKYAGPSILGSVRDTSGRASHSHLVLSASKGQRIQHHWESRHSKLLLLTLVRWPQRAK